MLPERSSPIGLFAVLTRMGRLLAGRGRHTPAEGDPRPTPHPELDLDAPETARLAAALERSMRWDRLYRQNLSLGTLARALGESRHRLSRLLNDGLGIGFYDYVNGYRIDEAKALLLADGERTASEIARVVGFRSRESFYRAFKKVTGTTPGRFRRRLARLP